jgi:RNA polymerase primary sigma factor
VANDDDKVQKDDEVVEETQVVNAADFHEPSFDELEDEEEDTPEDILNSGQYFDDISDDSVRLHLREIGKIPLLSAEEELALAQRVVAGDKRAKDKMAEARRSHWTAACCRKVRPGQGL